LKEKSENTPVTFHTGTPFFLEHSSRRLFSLLFNASPGVAFKGVILHFPAFGEEMNKSRAMVVLQARAMSRQGFTVLVPDYFGTGDSSGDFSEASWRIWLEDMRYCLGWLQNLADGPVILWGLRLGALMALELAAELECKYSQLVLWNPVFQGEQYMLQFLRLRLANNMMSGEIKNKVADLEQQLEREGVLEVAGYELSTLMFKEIVARKAITLDIPQAQKIFLVYVAPTIKSLPAPVQALVDQWLAADVSVETGQVVGPQFWTTQEISQVDELIERTVDWFKTVIEPSH